MKVFKDSADFPRLKILEENWKIIKEEYLAISDKTIKWPETALYNKGWDAFGLFFKGDRLPSSALCPMTTKLIHTIPGLFIGGFSVLRPGCQIKPHTGYTEAVWRSHLGLICPNDAWIVVNNEKYTWQEGKIVVFDDTLLHSAMNNSDSDRVILIVDFAKEKDILYER
jgi:aspartyl/asparaginyl beta-hydroxylase (cupin superfamily)